MNNLIDTIPSGIGNLSQLKKLYFFIYKTKNILKTFYYYLLFFIILTYI